ncbi:MAG TPA: ABC transporter ATP-binding protein [Chloroflexota bacterium]|nr:ABC transporter ATP-binding protein [Chloroflexota bacterium]
MAETILKLDNVVKVFGKTRAVDGSSFEVARGEFFTLLGPSGCGKTTTLRMVAGLERNDAGVISYGGQPIADPSRGLFVPPHKRNVGMVFQSYAIWPHMTVFENVAYPLRLRKVSNSVIKDKVERVLELVGMGGLGDRPAPLLSGGQQQRVALCRALVYEPDLLLLDEPFSNLDAKLREQMRIEVKLLQRQLQIAVLFVTHDQTEALTMSDRIAVMNLGKTEQMGPPASLYDEPASPFVRDFLGQTVSLKGELVGDSTDTQIGIAVGAGSDAARLFSKRHSLDQLSAGSVGYISIRPEDIDVERANGDSQARDNTLLGTIETLLFIGDRWQAQIALPYGDELLLFLPRSVGWEEGQSVRLTFPPERTHIWPA